MLLIMALYIWQGVSCLSTFTSLCFRAASSLLLQRENKQALVHEKEEERSCLSAVYLNSLLKNRLWGKLPTSGYSVSHTLGKQCQVRDDTLT